MNVIHRTVTAEVGGYPCNAQKIQWSRRVGTWRWVEPVDRDLILSPGPVSGSVHFSRSPLGSWTWSPLFLHTLRIPSLSRHDRGVHVFCWSTTPVVFHSCSECTFWYLTLGLGEKSPCNETFATIAETSRQKIKNIFLILPTYSKLRPPHYYSNQILHLKWALLLFSPYLFLKNSFFLFFHPNIYVSDWHGSYRKPRLVLGPSAYLVTVLGACSMTVPVPVPGTFFC